MLRIGRRFDEKTIRRIFVTSLSIKAGFALVEILGGIAAWLLTQKFLVDLASEITQGELAEDPHDFIASHLLHAAQNLTLGTQHFTAAYLFSHGLVKLWLVAGLLRRRLWYYPAAMIVFVLFIGYQLYRFCFTGSLWLVIVTIVDAVVVALTWHEFRHLRRSGHRPANSAAGRRKG